MAAPERLLQRNEVNNVPFLTDHLAAATDEKCPQLRNVIARLM
jgi:hypothetical protein